MWHLSTMLQDGADCRSKYTYQNGAFVVSLPEATTDQWQAQMHVELDKVIALSVDKTYDFR